MNESKIKREYLMTADIEGPASVEIGRHATLTEAIAAAREALAAAYEGAYDDLGIDEWDQFESALRMKGWETEPTYDAYEFSLYVREAEVR